MILQILILGFVDLVLTIMNIIFAPINFLVAEYLPVVQNNLSTITSFFDTITPTIAYALSYTMLPTPVLSYVVSYWTFTLVLLPSVYIIKLFLKWLKQLK